MKEVGSKLEVYNQLALHTKHNYFKRDLYYDNTVNKVRVIKNSSMVGGSILPNIFNFRLIKKELNKLPLKNISFLHFLPLTQKFSLTKICLPKIS